MKIKMNIKTAPYTVQYKVNCGFSWLELREVMDFYLNHFEFYPDKKN